MARSAEAIKKRALKRNRTEEDQRTADAKDMQKLQLQQLEVVMASAKRQKLPVLRESTLHKDGDGMKKGGEEASVTTIQTAAATTVSPVVKQQQLPRVRDDNEYPCPQGRTTSSSIGDRSDPLNEPGAWKCPRCDNHNFASRSVCHSKTCGETRPFTATEIVLVPASPRATTRKPRRGGARHDENTSRKQEWVEQARPQTLAQNQHLRERYLETGGKGMDEADVNRAKILIERDERKKMKKELKMKEKKSKSTKRGKEEGTLQSSSNNNNNKSTVDNGIGTEHAGPHTLAKNQHIRKRFLETRGEGMDEADVHRAKILIERDARKKTTKVLKMKENKSKSIKRGKDESTLQSSSNNNNNKSNVDNSLGAEQAGLQTLAQNQYLRKRYLETGGEGMDEADVHRAKILIERDERKKKLKESKRKGKSKSTRRGEEHAQQHGGRSKEGGTWQQSLSSNDENTVDNGVVNAVSREPSCSLAASDKTKPKDDAPETLSKSLSLVKKLMRKILNRAPGGRMKMKVLRREIGTQLLIEKKPLMKMMEEHLGPNSKKMILDGEDVILLTV